MILLSIIIPALNEARRLPAYLASIREWVEAQHALSYEVLVVDDGSKDQTPEILAEMASDWPNLVICTHDCQRGKGAAVRTGILNARGECLLFTDADGATPIREEIRFRDALESGYGIAIGSRYSPDSAFVIGRTLVRDAVGKTFAWLVRKAFRLNVRDTQCGFKMFRRDVALNLFRNCQETGYLFDLEILARARQLGVEVAEVPVSWHEVPGSKIRIVRDSLAMFGGLFRLWCAIHWRASKVDCSSVMRGQTNPISS